MAGDRGSEDAMDSTSSRRLQRQRSCACRPLDVVGRWCGSRRGGAGFARMQYSDDDECYDYEEEKEELAREPSPPLFARGQRRRPPWSSYPGTRLRRLWRRIMRERSNIVSPAVAAKKAEPQGYDAYTYAQNFDEGAAWAEPENLSRSFSARFAVPSRVLQELS